MEMGRTGPTMMLLLLMLRLFGGGQENRPFFVGASSAYEVLENLFKGNVHDSSYDDMKFSGW